MPAKFSLEQPVYLEKNQGACCLAMCQQRAQAHTYLWVGGWRVLCENQRGREGRVLLEFHVRKQCKVREFFLWVRPAKSMLWFIIITLLAELGASDWLVISFMGGEGEYLLLGLGCLETQYRHLVWNPHRYIYTLERYLYRPFEEHQCFFLFFFSPSFFLTVSLRNFVMGVPGSVVYIN